MIYEPYSNVIDLSRYWWIKCMKWAKGLKWPVFSFVDASGQEVHLDYDTWAEWLGCASDADLKALVIAQKAYDAASRQEVNN